ncbi:MAG: ABC transporter permease [Bacteroidales bacterium]|nr:ABC transporter permease [Bacteroidales bacterium]
MMRERLISSNGQNVGGYLRILFAHRNLIWVFALRDIKSKYAQTFLGTLWGFLQPLITLLIFSFFFGVLLKVNTGETPYICFVFTGLMFWYNFTAIVNSGSVSLLQSQELIKKIYFPKLTLVVSKAVVAFFEFLFMLLIMFFLMCIYGMSLRAHILILPALLLLNALTALSVAIWMSALTIKYRDLQHIMPYLIGFGIFVTPVFFPTTLIPKQFAFLIYINPLAGIVEWNRWAFMGGLLPPPEYIWGFVVVGLLLITGLWYFFRNEDNIADYI